MRVLLQSTDVKEYGIEVCFFYFQSYFSWVKIIGLEIGLRVWIMDLVRYDLILT